MSDLLDQLIDRNRASRDPKPRMECVQSPAVVDCDKTSESCQRWHGAWWAFHFGGPARYPNGGLPRCPHVFGDALCGARS